MKYLWFIPKRGYFGWREGMKSNLFPRLQHSYQGEGLTTSACYYEQQYGGLLPKDRCHSYSLALERVFIVLLSHNSKFVYKVKANCALLRVCLKTS